MQKEEFGGGPRLSATTGSPVEENLQLVLPTLRAVALIVRPQMIVKMPLPPPSIIVVIIVVILALAGGIVVGGGTQGGCGTVPGSWKPSVKKGKG